MLVAALLCAAVCGSTLAASSALAETQGEVIVQDAASQMGVPYCFAGGEPTIGPTHGKGDYEGEAPDCTNSATRGFDCSGLALWAVYQATGGAVDLPHSASLQASRYASYGGQLITSESGLEPGDLIFFGDPGGLSNATHVGIYAGPGKMWDANTAWGSYGDGVYERSISETEHDPHDQFLGGVRYWHGSVGGREPNGSFIKVTGAPAIYRVIGGAPVHVDSCAPLGGCPGLVEVPSLSGYATLPENGAYMRMANGPLEGLVARVAGGDPLGLTTCEGLSGCNEAINLDEGGFNEYVAAHQTIASGTFVRVADGSENGLIGRVVGGVLLGLTTCEGMESEGCAAAVNVAENVYNSYASEYHVIADGTFVRVADGPLAGLIARAAGGALIGLASCVPLEECPGVVDIAENAFVSYAAEHPEPANGTLVEGLPSGTYWSFDNGQREPAAPNSSAIAIDDRGLDAYPIKTNPSGKDPTPLTPPSTSTGGGAPNNSMALHGVLGIKTAKSPESASSLSRALVTCHKIKNRHKRAECEARARKRSGRKRKPRR